MVLKSRHERFQFGPQFWEKATLFAEKNPCPRVANISPTIVVLFLVSMVLKPDTTTTMIVEDTELQDNLV